MPYNPGVQDISGQLFARGISQFGEGLAQGIEVYGKQKEERNFLTASIENKLGVALNEMQKFQANPKLYGGVAPITPEMLEQFQTAPGASLGKLKALNADLDVTLARSQDAINNTLKQAQLQQYQTHTLAMQDELTTAQKDREAMLRATLEVSQLPEGEFSGEAAYKIAAKHGLSPKGMETFTRGVQDLLPKATAGMGPTAAMRDAEATIAAEIAAGKLKTPEEQAARRAELLAHGGKAPPQKFFNAGTFVDRSNDGNPVAAVRDANTGMVGTVDEKGVFKPIDSAKYKPMTTSDSNTSLNAESFRKLHSEVLDQEVGVRAINRLAKDVGGLPEGINKLTTSISAAANTILGKPLTKEEELMGIEKARAQRVLGALRTTILGPGVMTEIDAQRILAAMGGDITSALSNKAIIQQTIQEILQDKMTKYEADLGIYNAGVLNRYGASGYKQRPLLAPFDPKETSTPSSGGSRWKEQR